MVAGLPKSKFSVDGLQLPPYYLSALDGSDQGLKLKSNKNRPPGGFRDFREALPQRPLEEIMETRSEVLASAAYQMHTDSVAVSLLVWPTRSLRHAINSSHIV